MAAEFDHQKKNGMKSKARMIDAGSGGGITAIVGALIAAAISAAFVAHRARRNAGRKSRNRDAVDKCQEQSPSEKSESEKGDEGSEGAWASSIESGADKVWPEEVIGRRTQSPEFDGGIKDNGEEEPSSASSVEVQETSSNDSEISEETRGIHDNCKISDKIVEETRENQIEPDDGNADTSSTDAALPANLIEEQKSRPAESGERAQQLEDAGEENTQPKGLVFVDGSEANQENASNDFKDYEVIMETVESQVGGEEEVDENHEIEFQAENACKREEEQSEGSMNSSAGSSRLEVWRADAIEQENGDGSTSVAEIPGNVKEMDGSAEGAIYKNSGLVQESLLSDIAEIDMPDNDTTENLKESAKDADKVTEEGMISHVDEESEMEGSMETGNSPTEFDSKGLCPTEIVELEKASEFVKDLEDPEVAHIEEKEELGGVEYPSAGSQEQGAAECDADGSTDLVQGSLSDIVKLDMPENEISESLTGSEIIHLEAEAVNEGGGGCESKSMEEELRSTLEEENEREGSTVTGNSPMEFDGQGVCAAELAELEKDSVPMHDMKQQQTVENMHKSISGDSSVDLDAENEEGKQTFKNSEMVMQIGEQGVEATERLQDLEEPEVSHVDETEEQGVEDQSVGSQEQDTESSAEGKRTNKVSEETTPDSVAKMSAATNSQRDANEEEKEPPSTENEMKLQFETTKKTADISTIGQAEQEEEHDQEAKGGSETMATGREKGMDFVIIGSPKTFLLVLALALAVGLLAVFHHEQLRQYNHGIPKIYDQLYELFF